MRREEDLEECRREEEDSIWRMDLKYKTEDIKENKKVNEVKEEESQRGGGCL